MLAMLRLTVGEDVPNNDVSCPFLIAIYLILIVILFKSVIACLISVGEIHSQNCYLALQHD